MRLSPQGVGRLLVTDPVDPIVWHLHGVTRHRRQQKTTLGCSKLQFFLSPHPSKNVTVLSVFLWKNTLLHQTFLGVCSGKPQAFLPYYLSFPRNEEQIFFFAGSLNCIRTLPRKCKKKRVCPQPTSQGHLVSATVHWIRSPAWFCRAPVTTSPYKITGWRTYAKVHRKF